MGACLHQINMGLRMIKKQCGCTLKEVIAVATIICAMSYLVIESGITYASGSYLQGLIRTKENIVREFSSKPDFSGISLEAAMKFTKVPDVALAIEPHTEFSPNDGFSIHLKTHRACEAWAMGYKSFSTIVINGKSFTDFKTIHDARRMLSECNDGENDMLMIYTRPKISQ
jgi:hypothetical protein